MPGGGHREGHHERTKRGAAEACETPDAMEAGDNGAVEEGLHADGLGVDGNIEQVPRRPETNQGDHQLPGVRSKANAAEHEIEQDGADDHDAAAVKSAEQNARERKGTHQTDGQGKEDGAELSLIE